MTTGTGTFFEHGLVAYVKFMKSTAKSNGAIMLPRDEEEKRRFRSCRQDAVRDGSRKRFRQPYALALRAPRARPSIAAARPIRPMLPVFCLDRTRKERR